LTTTVDACIVVFYQDKGSAMNCYFYIVKFYDGAKLLGKDADVLFSEEENLVSAFKTLKEELSQEACREYSFSSGTTPKAVVTKLKRIQSPL
jgi:hypothetical protein